MKLTDQIGQLWSTTRFQAHELRAYAEEHMVEETRTGVRAMSVVFLMLLLGSLLVYEKIGLGRQYLYTCAALATLSVHVYFSARAINEIKSLHVLGMTLLIISGTAFVLLAHQTGAFGAALFSSVVLLFMVVPMVPWGLREASLVTLLIYAVFSSSTWSVSHRFPTETLWTLQVFMFAAATVSLTLVARGASVRKQDISARFELEKSHHKMELLSYQDALTGAWNRRFLEGEFETYKESMQKSGMLVHFALLDLDNFKQMNDICGHMYGDQMLCWMAESFRQKLGDSGFAVRTGGDEFGLLLSGDEPEALISEAVEAVREAADAEERRDAPGVSVSVGLVTLLPGVEVSLDEAYQAADRELYQAKEGKSSGPSVVRISHMTVTHGRRGSGEAWTPER
ncbi:MAG: GGDEF domain-containing protein [Myxococcota bacterium]